jgi:hypothetical protein
MLCEVVVFELESVTKLAEATLEDTAYRHRPTNPSTPPTTNGAQDQPRPSTALRPELWWITSSGGNYLTSNAAHLGLDPVPALIPPAPANHTHDQGDLHQAIALDDELILDVLTAADVNAHHLVLMQDNRSRCHLAATTLRQDLAPQPPSPSNGITRFAMDPATATEWLTLAILCHEYEGDLSPDKQARGLPPIGLAWNPSEPGQEQTIVDLLRLAQTESGPVKRPQDTSMLLDIMDDGDDGAFRFLVELSGPVALRLAGPWRELRDLASGQQGSPAALCILTEAIDAANELLTNLNSYVANADRG